MLGFSTFSETSYSQSDPSVSANAFVGDLLALNGVGLFSIDAKAHVILPEAPSAVFANTLADIDAQAHISLTAYPLSVLLNNPEDVDAQATSVIVSVASTLATPTLTDVDAKANSYISPVTVTVNVNQLSDVDAKAHSYIQQVLSQLDAGIIDPIAKANSYIISPRLTLVSNTLGTDAVKYPYSPTAYSQSRLLYLLSESSNRKVFVLSENRTLLTLPESPKSYSVYVTPEDRKVTIQQVDSNNNTVYIAR